MVDGGEERNGGPRGPGLRGGTPARGRGRRRFSVLTARILAINLFAVAILFVGVLYLDRYQNSLIRAEIEALTRQGEIFARAIGEIASDRTVLADAPLSNEVVRRMVRRAGASLQIRSRVFLSDGTIIADSLIIGRPGGLVRMEPLPPPAPPSPMPFREWANEIYDDIVNWLPRRAEMPRYMEQARQRAEHYNEVLQALSGQVASAVRVDRHGDLVLSVAIPVQSYKQVRGALLLSTEGGKIDEAVRSVRFEILGVFAVVFTVTVLLSLYLAGTITRPIQRLATAAEGVRVNRSRVQVLPDFGPRRDEIGDLARSFRAMTEDLWQRMDATERFAADVAHEIKNPLTSVRSAVETVTRIEDPAQRARLLAIVMDDVDRLDRLITDISEASRLDAELSRAETEPVPIARMLETLSDVHQAGAEERGVQLDCRVPEDDALEVRGHEDRLVQVIRNLLGNAESFSPEGGRIRLSGSRDRDHIVVTVSDEGPGVPPSKLDAIFDRFYSERPEGEKFGTHSGLGLSISKQIIEAHGGEIWAENRVDGDGTVLGAVFTVRMPRL